MIRAVVGSSLLLSGLGLAAAFVAPSLAPALPGDLMIVGGRHSATLQPARFDGAGCAPRLARKDGPSAPAYGYRIVGLAFQGDGDGVRIVATDVAGDAVLGDETLLLLLDASGRLVASGPAAALADIRAEQAAAELCSRAADAATPDGV